MTTHFLIRHAESIGNAGGRTSDPAAIPLSPNGLHQAKDLVEVLAKLDVQAVFYSPFLRTQETAAPFLASRPDIPVGELEIQEFTHLEQSRVENTTEAERRTLRDAFWDAMDPDLKDGPNSESFNDLLGRIDNFCEILPTLPNRSAIFGHGRFFTIFCLRVANPQLTPKETMKLAFHSFHVEKQNFLNAVVETLSIHSNKIIPPTVPRIGIDRA